MFIAALLLNSPSNGKPKWPSFDEYISKMWYIQTMGNYLTIKRAIEILKSPSFLIT